jgi:hypothetical protein
MAATPVSHVYANVSTNATITFAGLVVAAGQTVFVYLNSRDGSGGANYASATWNGGAATVSESANGTLVDGIQFHRLVFRGLAAGTFSLVVTLSAAQDDMAGWAVVVDDADQTTTLGSAAATSYPTTAGSQLGGSVSLTGGANDIIITTVRNRAGTAITEDGGQTLIGTDQTAANGNTLSISYEAGTGSSSSVGWTWATNPSFDPWAMDAVVIQGVSGSSPPSITDVDTDESITSTQTNVVVTGTDFDTAAVAIEQDAVSKTQSIDSQNATTIQFDVVFDAGANDLKYGAATLVVTNGDAQDDTIAITIAVPSGRAFIDLVSVETEADNRITAVADLEIGDQLEISNVTGTGVDISDVVLNNDGTFDADAAVESFDVRVWDHDDATWGTPATQTVAAPGDDETPDAFVFNDTTNQTPSSTQTSNTITVAGLGSGITVDVTIVGGTYSKNGGGYVSTPGTATNGDTFAVRHTASASYSTNTDTTLTIGTGSDTFRSTTRAEDATPATFTFTDVTGRPRNQVNTSNPITVSGLDTGTSVAVTIAGGSGEYSKNGGAFVSSAGTAFNGDTFAVRVTSSNNYSTGVSTTLTIGGVADTYTATTGANVAPAFAGPSIDNFTIYEDVAMTPRDFSARFTDANSDPLTFTAQGTALPAGLSLSAAGVLSGTPTTSAVTTGVIVRASDGTATQDSNAFNITVTAAPDGGGAVSGANARPLSRSPVRPLTRRLASRG